MKLLDQKLKNYSSGMQVRLAFSVSIYANREILLMDEVLAVGDSNFQSKCLTEFNRYKEMGKTVILVTHDIAVVQRYCDRAMLLRNGKIKEIGKADEVSDKYIFDNMSDEEDRMSQDVDNRRKKRGDKNKVAKIIKVEFLDKNGKTNDAIRPWIVLFESIDPSMSHIDVSEECLVYLKNKNIIKFILMGLISFLLQMNIQSWMISFVHR